MGWLQLELELRVAMNTIPLSKAEKSYIQSSLLSTPPLRIDGRSLPDFRTVALETGVSPLANGSARLDIGRNLQDGGGGTEVLAAVKVEVEDIENGVGVDGGKVVCTVSWYASFYFNWQIAKRWTKVVLQPHIHIYLLEH